MGWCGVYVARIGIYSPIGFEFRSMKLVTGLLRSFIPALPPMRVYMRPRSTLTESLLSYTRCALDLSMRGARANKGCRVGMNDPKYYKFNAR